MQYTQLRHTDLNLSRLMLGSMTWGSQNTQDEGFMQMDHAVANGINCIDTAEMYPTNPITAETQGETERIIGRWIANRGRRDDLIIATKVSGQGLMHVRDGIPISAATMRLAIEESLRALATDYIDIYQLHWPNRGSYAFRKNWHYDPSDQDSTATAEHMLEVLEMMQILKQEGKIRYPGLSNESCWGVMRWLGIAEHRELPRMVTVQNEYSLLCRLYDLDMAEMSHHEGVGLLAFSPLAAGLLSGKYGPDETPAGSRRSITSNLGGRTTDRVWPAIAAYQALARDHGLDPAQMALAWCLTRPFMTSAIFGATSMQQLDTAIGAATLELSEDVMQGIADIHKAHPLPY